MNVNTLTRRSVRAAALALLVAAAGLALGLLHAPQSAAPQAYLPCHVSTCDN